MAPKLFVVQFDKPNATYQAGETITGCVIIDLEESKNCRDLLIAIKGFAYVHWTESNTEKDINGKDRTVTDHYSATERYFDFQQPLIRRPPEQEGLVLPAGRSEYRFSYQLPSNIPSSFEHHIGYIRYTIKGIIDIPWRLDWWTKAAFTVITPFDLNAIAHQCVPIDDEVEKTYSCCFSNRGSIYAEVKLLTTGYVPGQTIDVDVSCHVKSSSVRVTSISASLEQEISFHAQSRTKKVTMKIQKAQYDGSFRNNKNVLLKLLVPPIPPSILLPCQIIQLEYRIIVNVHVNGMYRKIHRTYPILIGSMPLYSMWPHRSDNRELQPSAPSDPSGNKVAPYPSNLPGMVGPGGSSTQPIGWSMPPPSYEECLQQAKNIKDPDDSSTGFGVDKNFAPRYPVFNFNVVNKSE